MELGSLQTELTISLRNFAAGMQQAATIAQNVGSKLSSNLGGPAQTGIDKTTQSVDKLKMGFKDLERIVGGILISQFFYNMTNNIQQAAGAMVTFMNNMQRAQIQMTYFLGSADKAKGFIQQMQDFASSTAMDTEQALSLATQLMNSGFQPGEIKNVMGILNDASVVGGGTPEMMNRIVIAIQQIRNTGKLMGQDLRQLAQAGLPVYDILSKQLGIAKSKLLDLKNVSIDGQTAVYALLRGMQERYQGAAQQVAKTVPGLWQNIVDDTKIVGESLFQTPYMALQKFLTKWKDTFDKAKEIVRHEGIGGLLEHFVPPQLQDSVRAIVGSIESLGGSFKRLQEALHPVTQLIAATFTLALGHVLPIVAAIIRGIANFASAALKTSPIVRGFAAAIGTIMIATFVGRSLMFLWSVTRMGVICVAIGKAVGFLSKSIAILNIVLTKSKIGVILTLVGALLYLAMSSRAASGWLDALWGKISKLAGFNLSDTLQPDPKTDDWLKQVNDALGDTNDQLNETGDGMDNAGDKSEKAGKKIKDKFVASFDELYQVPDKLDDISSGFGNLGDSIGNMKVPDLPDIGNLPDPSVPNPNGDGGDGWNLPPWMKGGGGGPDDSQKGGDIKFDPPPFDATAIVTAIGTVKDALANLKKKFADVGADMKQWVVDGVGNIGDWVSGTVGAFQDWAGRTAGIVGNWIGETVGDLNSFATQGAGVIGGFAVDTSKQLLQWTVDTLGQMGDWSTQTIATIGTWATTAETSISNWATNTWQNFVTWGTNTGQTVTTWAANTGASISSWITDTGTSFATWSSDVWNSVKTWSTNTATSVRTWASTTEANIGVWANTTLANFSTWSSNVITNVKSWATSTGTTIYNWATNAAGNIDGWATATMSAVVTWATNTSGNISTWVVGTSKNIGDWVQGVVTNFGQFANNSMDAVNSFASGAWDGISSFLSGSANGIYSWASSTIDTIVSWAQSAWGAIKNLASAVGHDLGGAFHSAGSGISHAASSMGHWASKNSNWLIPTAIGVGVAAAATATFLSGGLAAPIFAPLLALETGGIVDQDQLVRIGEGNKREAVIPLENSAYMRPFSHAVASDLLHMLQSDGGGGSSQALQQILYVGTLVADERSLKDLERRMRIIRLANEARGAAE